MLSEKNNEVLEERGLSGAVHKHEEIYRDVKEEMEKAFALSMHFSMVSHSIKYSFSKG